MFLLPILAKLAHHPFEVLQVLLFGVGDFVVGGLGLGDDWGWEGLVLFVHEVGLLLLVLEDLLVEVLLDLCVLLLFLYAF